MDTSFPKYSDSAFCITDTGIAEITITGKQNARLLSIAKSENPEEKDEEDEEDGKRVILVTGNSLIRFEKIILDGTKIRGDGGGILIAEGAKVILGGGTIITGNTAQKGGGVAITGGNLIIAGGIITRNSAKSKGGGVYVEYGVCTILGGEITENRLEGDNPYNTFSGEDDGGNALFIGEGSQVEISGGIIAGCSGFCCNIYAASGSELVVTGGKMGHNDNAGVYIAEKAEFTMSGGIITGNRGYGIHLGVPDNKDLEKNLDDRNAATLMMSGGVITKNESESGIGIYVDGHSSCTLTGGSIRYNKTGYERKEEGIYVSKKGAFVMHGGAITVNISDKEPETRSFLSNLKYIYGHIPEYNKMSDRFIVENNKTRTFTVSDNQTSEKS